MDFHCLARPRNVSACNKCLCNVYPLESGEVMALILY